MAITASGRLHASSTWNFMRLVPFLLACRSSLDDRGEKNEQARDTLSLVLISVKKVSDEECTTDRNTRKKV